MRGERKPEARQRTLVGGLGCWGHPLLSFFVPCSQIYSKAPACVLSAALGVTVTHSRANRMAGRIRACFRETTAGEADGSTGGGSCLLNGGNRDGLCKDAFEHGLEEALGAYKGEHRSRQKDQ